MQDRNLTDEEMAQLTLLETDLAELINDYLNSPIAVHVVAVKTIANTINWMGSRSSGENEVVLRQILNAIMGVSPLS